jgi:triosephosphate isomerase
MTPRPLIAGNWKMNGLTRSLDEARAIIDDLSKAPVEAQVALCPPATLIAPLAALVDGTGIAVGGQDCRAEENGPFTGDIAAEQLKDAGATFVILGHSERRSGHGETDYEVAAKVEAALRAGLRPIICCGETVDEREDGHALGVITGQLDDSLVDALRGKAYAIAYEPVWAIGSGRIPTMEQIEEMHRAIRALLVRRFGVHGDKPPILYGGSVKPGNAAEILRVPQVGGALVGGATLKASDFLPIIHAAP